MNKKLLILLSCMILMLIACQNEKASSNQTDEGNNASENDTTEENEETAALPDAPLQKTDESTDVQALQEMLKKLDYPLETTGTYDDMTTWAVTDIQLQQNLQVSGIYDDETKETVEQLLEDDGNTITVGEGLEEPSHPDEYPDDVENPYDVLALVNKNHALPEDYEPEDLVIPDVRFPFEEDIPKKYMRKIAAEALEDMIAAGDEDGVAIFGQSGFRAYDRQVEIFAANAEKNGEEHANTYSARPGESEHQTGLVMDVTSEDAGFDLDIDFGETEEGKWIKEHAHEYGFIIRYPKDKVDITQYQYEPWHLRYVGEKAAAEIYENSETLEEYLGTE